MIFILWIAVFLLGCLAQILITQDLLIPGLLVYAFAGTLSAVLLIFPRSQAWDEQAPHSWQNDLDPLAFSISLITLGVSLWLIATGANSSNLNSSRLTYALLFWLGFLLLLLLAVRKPILISLKHCTLRSWLPLLFLLLFALGLGLFRLTEVPFTVHGDEGMVGLHARKIIEGKIPTFFASTWYALPQFFFFIPAASLYLFGDSLFGLRMSTVIMGLLTLIPFYLLAQRWWGWKAALLAGFMLIANHWFLHLMHCGVNYIQVAFFSITTFALSVYANEKRSLAYCVLAGAFIGLALQSYQANHLLPLLWCATQVGLLLLHKISWRWFALSLAIPLLMTLLTFSPLITFDLSRRGQLEMFSARAEGVIAWKPHNLQHLDSVYQAQGDHSLIWRKQFQRAFLAPIRYSDTSMQYGGQKPFLDPIAAVLFMLAFFITAYRFYDPRWSLPFAWILAFLITGGAFTVDTPFYPRLAGITALLFLPLAGLFASLQNSTRKEWDTNRAVIAFSTLLALISMGFNLHAYFHVFAKETDPANIHYPQTHLAYYIKDQGAQTFFYVLSSGHFRFDSGTVQFLAKNHEGRDLHQLPDPFPPGPLAVIVDDSKRSLRSQIEHRLPEAVKETVYSPMSGSHLFTAYYRE